VQWTLDTCMDFVLESACKFLSKPLCGLVHDFQLVFPRLLARYRPYKLGSRSLQTEQVKPVFQPVFSPLSIPF
jgi:hypothetical protein